MKTNRLTMTATNVNSKKLCDEIMSFISDEIHWEPAELVWSEAYRTSLSYMFTEYLADLYQAGKIEQWRVINDERNNTQDDIDSGNFIYDISYKQKNCLNTTNIRLILHG